MPKGRGRRGLLKKLDETADERAELDHPEPLRVSQQESSEAYDVRAFCPIRKEETGAGTCRHIDCGRCPFLLDRLKDTEPEYVWLCTTCTLDFVVLPYWTDGECEDCGFPSSVLMLAVPP